MHKQVTESTGRAAVLDAASHHPYALLSTGGDVQLRVFRSEGVTLWLRTAQNIRSINGLGDGDRAVPLLAWLGAEDQLAGVRRLHLPRVADDVLSGQLPVAPPDHWDFRWSRRPPPRQPGQDRVVPLEHGDQLAVAALLQVAFPASLTRPGDPRVRRWYAIREGQQLVACGADRSRGGVGSLGALAVHPDHRGRGLGAALTAAIAGQLFREFAVVTLGVMVDNLVAAGLYQRLGFTHFTALTSADLVS
jgi:GNAT superfamily N-acetyltransferase